MKRMANIDINFKTFVLEGYVQFKSVKTCCSQSRPRGDKTFFILNSIEHDFFLLINVKMPTIVGISTFMSRKNSILGLSESEES